MSCMRVSNRRKFQNDTSVDLDERQVCREKNRK